MLVKELKELLRDLPDEMFVCDHDGRPFDAFVFDPKAEGCEPVEPEPWEGYNETRLIVTFD